MSSKRKAKRRMLEKHRRPQNEVHACRTCGEHTVQVVFSNDTRTRFGMTEQCSRCDIYHDAEAGWRRWDESRQRFVFDLDYEPGSEDVDAFGHFCSWSCFQQMITMHSMVDELMEAG